MTPPKALFRAGATTRCCRLIHAGIRGGGKRARDFALVGVLRRILHSAQSVYLEEAAEIVRLILGVAEGGAAVRDAVRAVSDRLPHGR